jgi:hypothetical protein
LSNYSYEGSKREFYFNADEGAIFSYNKEGKNSIDHRYKMQGITFEVFVEICKEFDK